MMNRMRVFLCCFGCLYFILLSGCRQEEMTNTPDDKLAQLAAMEARFAEFDAKAAALPYVPIETTEDGVLILADANFMEAVNQGGILVVDFWMDNCPPCEDMVPVFKGLARLYKDTMRFAKLHDSNRIMTEKYLIQGFPTFVIFTDGKPATMLTGSQPQERFQMILDTILLDYQAKQDARQDGHTGDRPAMQKD